MTDIVYYSSWWTSWVERKLKGEGQMPGEIDLVCSHCGKNDNISENAAIMVEFVGRFNKYGEHVMDEGQTAIIGDSVDGIDTYFFCYNCGNRFNDPVTIEEFEQNQKEEINGDNGNQVTEIQEACEAESGPDSE